LKEERNIKLRQVIRKLNNVKRSQKKQIDILCNDILKAHTDFISHLKNFQFAADFYENIWVLPHPNIWRVRLANISLRILTR
jgi:fructose-1,6-bisphosphatase